MMASIIEAVGGLSQPAAALVDNVGFVDLFALFAPATFKVQRSMFNVPLHTLNFEPGTLNRFQ
jgi:hypothetical protein